MSYLKFRTGLAVASIAFGFGLDKIPRVREFNAVKKIAKKSKNYGVGEGKKIITEIINIDPQVAEDIILDVSNVIDDITNNNFFSKEKYHKDDRINVIFVEDDECIIPLLPEHKKSS